MSEKKLFFSVLLIKFFVFFCALLILGQEHFFWGDSFAYLHSAYDVQQGDGYNDSRRTPAYSIFLAFCLWLSNHYGVVLLLGLQIVAAAYSAVLVYRIALFFAKNFYAFLAAILFAFEPLGAIINMLVLAETFLALFLLIFVWQFLKYQKTSAYRFLIFSAVALAAAVWVKPVAAYLYVIPVLFLFFIIGSRWHAALFACVYCISILPWLVYTYTHFNFFGISAQGENNACGYMLISVYSTEHRTDPSDMDMSLFPPAFIEAQKTCMSSINSIQLALQYPKSFLKTIFLSTASMLTNEGYGVLFQRSPSESIKAHHNYLTAAVFADAQWFEKIKYAVQELQSREIFAVVVGKFFWIGIFLLTVVGLYCSLRNQSTQVFVLFLFITVAYFIAVTVVSTGYGVGARLRYPINPFLFIFASIGLSGIVVKMRRWKGLLFTI